MRCAALLGLAACAGAAPGDPTLEHDATTDDAAAAPVEALLWTEHLGQLVGTARSPYAPAGLRGTDLGVSFPVGDQLIFLFGDSWTLDGADWDRDSVATAAATYPADGALPALTWMTGPGGRFLPLELPGVDLGAMNVPVEGLVVGDLTYVFFTTGYAFDTGRHSHSVLAHTRGVDFAAMTIDHVVASDKFLNLNVVVDGDVAWIFGSGVYRESAVYLARAPVASLADRASWRYYQGGSDGRARYGPDEASAAPLVDEQSVGELSVRRHPTQDRWLMAYNGGSPRGIQLRTSGAPDGPWSAPVLIWQPADGYGHYLHAAVGEVGYDDGLGEPGREEEWGGEYGPYFVPAWFDAPGTPPGTTSLVYTLSSWNPYTVHLVRSVLGDPALGLEPPVRGAGLPPATIVNGDFAAGLDDWSSSGDTFTTFVGDDGVTRLTTFTEAEGEAATGTLWQDVTVDHATSELRFLIHGGGASVKLLRGDDVVRATHGRNQNQPELPVRWQLGGHRGETLRLVIDDDRTGAWGFVGATGFELR